MQAMASETSYHCGESHEFEDLVEQYYRPLYQFAFSLTHSDADAGDLTQQTFYIWRVKGEQLRDKTKVKSWLFTTMHRAFLQMRRRDARFPHIELEEAAPDLPRIVPDEASGLDSADVVTALNQIDDLCRAPLALFYLDDCPYKDIAAILNIPLGTVKSRIARGIVQLRDILLPVQDAQDAQHHVAA